MMVKVAGEEEKSDKFVNKILDVKIKENNDETRELIGILSLSQNDLKALYCFLYLLPLSDPLLLKFVPPERSYLQDYQSV